MKNPAVLIIAAEASSVLYAQRILEFWKNTATAIDAYGVGSNEMESLGFRRFGRSEDMAVMGVVEVAKHYSAIKKVFYDVLAEVDRYPPKVAVLLDYPGFNLRLAKELKQRNIPVVYYIPPQIWAWKQGRVKQIHDFCDRVLSLFPFEVDFYSRHNVKCELVGHPLIDEMKKEFLDESWVLSERRRCGIQDNEIVLGLMPGSRRGELNHHFGVQLEVARRLSHRVSNLKVLIMCAPSFEKADLVPYLDNFKINYMMLKTDPFKMIAMTDIVLAASGTATLMVGLLEKPMVIMYRMKWLTSIIAKIVVKGVKFFGITNLILNEEASPERFQDQANPDELERLLFDLISKPEVYEAQKNKLKQIRKQLGNGEVTEKVARILNGYLK
ncbi:MAG: lipid-A-disaccharide synthase [Bdellovibrionaceae bacterium]|nr:lipid-A-disaccharide synthase [Pseudobdellovibrionaceae bacterium]